MTKRHPLKTQLLTAKEHLQATDAQMAKRLGVTIDTYRALENGGRNLPVVAQRAIMKRIERMFRICGLKYPI